MDCVKGADATAVPMYPLEESQKQALARVKAQLQRDLEELPTYGDWRIVKFLKGQDWNEEGALAKISKDINDIDHIDEKVKKSPYWGTLITYYPGGHHKTDKHGSPVYYERVGLLDPPGLLNNLPDKDMVEFHIYIMELRARMLREAGIAEGSVIVQDLRGLGLKHMGNAGIEFLKKMMAIDEDHYPESLKRLYLVNTPALGMVIWNLLKPFIAPKTLQKISLHGGDFLPMLEAEIPRENIPKYLGGECQCAGGCVREGGSFKAVPIEYNKTSVSAGGDFDYLVHVESPHTVIEWDFRTDKYDIGFAVYRYEPVGDEEEDDEVEVVEYKRYAGNVPVREAFVADELGKYVLRWDNSYSKLRKKALSYTVSVHAAPLTSAASAPDLPRLGLPSSDRVSSTSDVQSGEEAKEKKKKLKKKNQSRHLRSEPVLPSQTA